MDDLLRLLARYRRILVIAFIVGGVLAAAVAVVKRSGYSATATIGVKDITELDAVDGSQLGPNGVPQVADTTETAATSEVVLRAALASLGRRQSVAAFRNTIAATLNLASDFVIVEASDSDARSAQSSANAVATATATYINGQVRQEAATAEARLNARVAALSGDRADRRERNTDQQAVNQLRTLAIAAAPARVTQPAELPTAPSPRHTAFYTLLGAVLGLLVGAAACFLREAFDKLVRRPDQVSARLGLPILADFTADDAEFVQVGLLRRNAELLGGDESLRMLLVTGSDPGAGAAATGTELARSFARVGRHTLLVDVNLRQPELQDALQLGDGPGLTQCLRGSTKLVDAVRTVDVPASEGTESGNLAALACLPAGSASPNADELLASERFRGLLVEASDSYEVIVLVASPLVGAADALELLPRTDACIVCVRLDHTTLGQLGAARGVLDRVPPKAAGVVLTGGASSPLQTPHVAPVTPTAAAAG